VSEFLNKQDGGGNNEPRLDAVDEVDSQMGATPYGQINSDLGALGNELGGFGKAVKLMKTPKDESSTNNPVAAVQNNRKANADIMNT